MKLIKLEISQRRIYEENPGTYQGVVEFEDVTGTLKLILDPQISAEALDFFGEAITRAANRAASQFGDAVKACIEDARKVQALPA